MLFKGRAVGGGWWESVCCPRAVSFHNSWLHFRFTVWSRELLLFPLVSLSIIHNTRIIIIIVSVNAVTRDEEDGDHIFLLMWISGNKVPKRIHLMNGPNNTHSRRVFPLDTVQEYCTEWRQGRGWVGGQQLDTAYFLFIFIGNHFSRLIERHPPSSSSWGW